MVLFPVGSGAHVTALSLITSNCAMTTRRAISFSHPPAGTDLSSPTMASELLDFIHARKAELRQRPDTDPEAVLLGGFLHALTEAHLFATIPRTWLLRLAQAPDLSVRAASMIQLHAALRASLDGVGSGRALRFEGELACFAALLSAGVPEPQVWHLLARWSFDWLAGVPVGDPWQVVLRGFLTDYGYSDRYIDSMIAADRRRDGVHDILEQRFLDAIDTEDDVLREFHNTLATMCTYSVAPDAWLLTLSGRPMPPIDHRSPLAPLHRCFAREHRGMVGTLAAFEAMLAAGVPEAVVLHRVDEEALGWLWSGACHEAWRPLLREYLYARGYRPDFIDDLIAERASPPADVTVDVEEV